jgi:hypothetical protein
VEQNSRELTVAQLYWGHGKILSACLSSCYFLTIVQSSFHANVGIVNNNFRYLFKRQELGLDGCQIGSRKTTLRIPLSPPALELLSVASVLSRNYQPFIEPEDSYRVHKARPYRILTTLNLLFCFQYACLLSNGTAWELDHRDECILSHSCTHVSFLMECISNKMYIGLLVLFETQMSHEATER